MLRVTVCSYSNDNQQAAHCITNTWVELQQKASARSQSTDKRCHQSSSLQAPEVTGIHGSMESSSHQAKKGGSSTSYWELGKRRLREVQSLSQACTEWVPGARTPFSPGHWSVLSPPQALTPTTTGPRLHGWWLKRVRACHRPEYYCGVAGGL